jgi:uncharacterized tellurite resistance protein B-like protein
MQRAKFNKDVTGYELLLILAEADGSFDPREGSVIIDFIKEAFPLGGNLDAAIENVSSLRPDEYPIRIEELAEDFYSESNEVDRKHFMQFAIKLVRADDKLDDEENILITKLFELWDL